MFTGKNKIKVKAICLFQNNGYIFVSKSYDHVKKDFYYRPIGGTTELGEFTINTITREILEEMNAEIENIRLKQVMENIFTCDGIDGHEIMFLYEGDFKDKKYYEIKEYEIIESNHEKIPAFWIKIDDFLSGKYRLVPEKLNEYLKDNYNRRNLTKASS